MSTLSKRLRVRVLYGAATAIGPGKAELLHAVARTGSIAAAAREFGMSYRQAWVLIDSANRCFREPLVLASKGGARGGGAALTATGQEVLRRYRAIEARAVTLFADLLAKSPPER